MDVYCCRMSVLGQSERQTAKFVTNLQLKKICHGEKALTVWPHTQNGQQEIKNTGV